MMVVVTFRKPQNDYGEALEMQNFCLFVWDMDAEGLPKQG
jgi:hypothetical protein